MFMNGMEKALSRARKKLFVDVLLGLVAIIIGIIMVEAVDKAVARNGYIDSDLQGDAQTMVGLCIFGGFASILYGICAHSVRVSRWKGDFVEAYGKIVTIESDWLSKMRGIKNVIVELNDGRCMKLITDLDMLFCEGDTGFIGIKGKGLVYINRIQPVQIINS